MKLQYIALCAVLASPAAFAQSGPKSFGDGTCLPKYLQHYDVNGDGVISEEERQVMDQARDQIRKQLRDSWDEDGDGAISDQERDKARLRLRDMIEECRVTRFNEADLDGDGALSQDEFETLPGMANKLPDGQELVDAIFDRLDANDDGLISLEEFLAAVKQCDRDRDGPNAK